MKKRHANLILFAAIALVAALAISFVGYSRGWFSHGGSVSCTPEGTVSLCRNGVYSPLTEETALQRDDQLLCETDASASITDGTQSIVLHAGELTVTQAEPLSLALTSGEVFAATGSDTLTLSCAGQEITLTDAIIALNAEAETLDVLRGTALCSAETALTGARTALRSGDSTPLSVIDLSDFCLAQLAANDTEVCFSETVLSEESARREAARLGDISAQDGAQTCTLEIRCDTILDNRSALKAAKASYVPADGVILAETTADFTEGETAFDVLCRVCESADIQLEYSWTPLYNSYYVEGINNLYEFDCGPESGWMYAVNGEFPSRGASAWKLQDGDAIRFLYTCTGLGSDLGASIQ